MRTFVDTHAHFDGIEKGDPAAVTAALERANAAGVTRVIAVGGDAEGNRIALRTAAAHPLAVRAAVGFNRHVAAQPAPDFPELERQLETAGLAAVGETGLDFLREAATAPAQILLFQRMLGLAAERRLPIVVHCREAEEAMGPLLEAHAARWRGEPDRIGVIHCFTGGVAFARRALACGFHFSFSGILTFPKAENVRTAAAAVPENRLLVETDTPYLAPVPHRGRPNEPMFTPLVAEGLAAVKGMTLEALAAQTTANARRLFGL
ncbi:MAG: TatD family hydrolase [Kiritimatiellia bacterium]